MKIFNLKKRYCNFMAGGMLAILPFVFFLTMMSSTVLSGQVDRPYPDDVYGTTYDLIKEEMLSLKLELKATDDLDVNILLMDYYLEVLAAFQNGELLHDAFIDKLLVFYTSEYSDPNSALHNTIFLNTPGNQGVISQGNDPVGQIDSSVPVDPTEHYRGLNETFVQLTTAVHNTNGNASSFNALFNFINSNK